MAHKKEVITYTDDISKTLTDFISKADTLKTLSRLLQKSYIEELYFFTREDWLQSKNKIVSDIQNKFQNKIIIVRSSALNEDTFDSSNAGCFTSILNVDSGDIKSIESAVEDVITSYMKKGAEDIKNPILVQSQTFDVIFSGTILTKNYNGSPYYIINYSDEDTTTVTSGGRSKSLKILKLGTVEVPEEFSKLVEAVKEIETFMPKGLSLDIEFGIKSNGDIVTFQVRPLVAAATVAYTEDAIFNRVKELKNKFKKLTLRKDHLAGETTYFGDMPDWNPAEIIGNSPKLLAASLYDEIITDRVWHEARTSQGYSDVYPAKLVIQFGNKPYVDVRHTFNSFVPASVSPLLKEKLVNFYLKKLKDNPELQDKIEFEILFTCYDLSFHKRTEELRKSGFSDNEINEIKQSVLALTNNLLDPENITNDIEENEKLENYRKILSVLPENIAPSLLIERAIDLLNKCKENGTLQFSRLARLGFVGKIILKSIASEGIIDKNIYETFLSTISTVASEFGVDMVLLNQGQLDKNIFIDKYGHLRPGTYDITIPRYDRLEDYLSLTLGSENRQKKSKEIFELDSDLERIITEKLNEHELNINAGNLFKFVRAALEAREYSKFLFTKCLSDAIEYIADAGARLHINRDDLSHLDVNAIKKACGKDDAFIKDYWEKTIKKNKSDYEINSFISLPPIIFTENDFDVISYYDSRPNYITSKFVQGDLAFLKGGDQVENNNITGKIVVIECADPGHDWVFSKKPAALITKYGGPASHMAIRCAELGLPAAIGVGDLIYETLLKTGAIKLDCRNQKIYELETSL